MRLHETTLFRCDICLKEEVWGESWATHIFPMDLRTDMYFHVCSEYCDRQLLNMTKAQKKKNFIERVKQGAYR